MVLATSTPSGSSMPKPTVIKIPCTCTPNDAAPASTVESRPDRAVGQGTGEGVDRRAEGQNAADAAGQGASARAVEGRKDALTAAAQDARMAGAHVAVGTSWGDLFTAGACWLGKVATQHFWNASCQC